MNKFFGIVGYAESVRKDGVVEDIMHEQTYQGDEIQNTRYFATDTTTLGKVSFQTRLSILADAYALKNYQNIRYVEWNGAFWLVDSVQVDRPRLILVVGEKYNGPTAEKPNG